MSNTRKRVKAHILLAASAVLVMGAAVGCSDSSAAEEEAEGSSSAAAGSGYQQALDYAECMRENGVEDYQDPEQGGDGRVLINPGNADDPDSQAAQEACRDKMPQGVGQDARGGDVDSAKVQAWAKCMRENGVPKFPDPEVEGGQIKINIDTLGMDPSDARMQKASAACQDKSPGGSLIFEVGE
ncbi:hypothetical protein [Streptomyces sp. JW3]|uniref:hypothetical protein n=1 Tax=Streptomyces sp. JW3 TaxID=3456955 RepID=UPI003FA40FC0